MVESYIDEWGRVCVLCEVYGRKVVEAYRIGECGGACILCGLDKRKAAESYIDECGGYSGSV